MLGSKKDKAGEQFLESSYSGPNLNCRPSYCQEEHNYILEISGLTFNYPDGTSALQGINLKIKSGKRIAVLGLNGAGKSTLFLQLNGILKPWQGKVRFRGEEVKYSSSFLKKLRAGVGIVFQNPDTQLFTGNVYQEVAFGLMNLQLPKEEIKKRVAGVLQSVDMINLQDRPSHLLSYGQKKLVAIMGVIAMRPQLLILDEPFAGLDPKHSRQIKKLLTNLNQDGQTIMLSTHSIDLASKWAQEVIILHQGKVAAEGLAAEVLSDRELLRSLELAE